MASKHISLKKDIDEFLALKKIALVGVSRKSVKFGNSIFKELKKRNYTVFPLNCFLTQYEGVPCYTDLKSLPEKVDGIITVVKPEKTELVIKEAAELGIKWIWMQQGSQSERAIELCKENNISFVANECILMFLEPVESVHKFHRFILKLFGKMPK